MAEIKARGDNLIFTGKVVDILDTKTVGNNGFMRRTFAIAREVNRPDRYANRAFDLIQENCTIGDLMKVGETVTVEAEFYSNRFDGKGDPRYFHNLTASRVWGENGVEFKPVEIKAKDWASLLSFATSHGEAEDALKARCRKYCEDKKVEYNNFTLKNWTELADGVPATASAAQEEMPF